MAKALEDIETLEDLTEALLERVADLAKRDDRKACSSEHQSNVLALHETNIVAPGRRLR
jgi:hypothetical protein